MYARIKYTKKNINKTSKIKKICRLKSIAEKADSRVFIQPMHMGFFFLLFIIISLFAAIA